MATDPTPPEFACDQCGADTIEIPEWTDDQTVLSCQECGKPIATISRILDALQAASGDNENEPPDDQVTAAASGPRHQPH